MIICFERIFSKVVILDHWNTDLHKITIRCEGFCTHVRINDQELTTLCNMISYDGIWHTMHMHGDQLSSMLEKMFGSNE